MAYIPTTGYKDETGREQVYWLEGNRKEGFRVHWMNADETGSFTQTANEFRQEFTKKTLKKASKLSKGNWEAAARAHADIAGYWTLMGEEAEKIRAGKREINPGKDRLEHKKDTQEWFANTVNEWARS